MGAFERSIKGGNKKSSVNGTEDNTADNNTRNETSACAIGVTNVKADSDAGVGCKSNWSEDAKNGASVHASSGEGNGSSCGSGGGVTGMGTLTVAGRGIDSGKGAALDIDN